MYGSGRGTEDEGPAPDRPAWAFSKEHRTDLLASRLSPDKPDGIRGRRKAERRTETLLR